LFDGGRRLMVPFARQAHGLTCLRLTCYLPMISLNQFG
jgi:hypothetical protein